MVYSQAGLLPNSFLTSVGKSQVTSGFVASNHGYLVIYNQTIAFVGKEVQDLDF